MSDELTGDTNAKNGGSSVNLALTQSITQSQINATGFIHCHLDDGSTFKVFSFADITALAEIATISTRPSNELAIYVVTNSGTFALKVSNRMILKNKLNDFISENDVYENFFDLLVKTEQSVDVQKLGLLKFMKKIGDLGVEIFEKDASTQEWQKLTLNSDQNQIIPTNCN